MPRPWSGAATVSATGVPIRDKGVNSSTTTGYGIRRPARGRAGRRERGIFPGSGPRRVTPGDARAPARMTSGGDR